MYSLEVFTGDPCPEISSDEPLSFHRACWVLLKYLDAVLGTSQVLGAVVQTHRHNRCGLIGGFLLELEIESE